MKFHTDMPHPPSYKVLYWRLRVMLGLPIRLPSSVTLSSIDLRKARFKGGLNNINLGGANLAEAVFTKQHITNVYFGGANLEGAGLSDIQADNVSFSEANLRRAVFEGSTLNGVSLLGSDLRGANLNETHLADLALAPWELKACSFVGCTYDHKTKWPQYRYLDLAGAKMVD